MAGAVAAGAHKDFGVAAAAMVRVDEKVYTPIAENEAVYGKLFAVYKRLHDSFGVRGHQEALFGVMKDLLAIRDAARA
jgi:L-ribulokinase